MMWKFYGKQVAHRWISELTQRLMISSTDLLAENYFLISLLGGDNNEKSL